jgi:hypothetical protein
MEMTTLWRGFSENEGSFVLRDQGNLESVFLLY